MNVCHFGLILQYFLIDIKNNHIQLSKIMNSIVRSFKSLPRAVVVRMYSGEPGSGAGKGGGGGGAIREAGGAFGKMEAANEDSYFYQQQRQQLENMKKHLHDEIDHHRDAIKRHEDAISRHKKKMADIEDKK